MYIALWILMACVTWVFLYRFLYRHNADDWTDYDRLFGVVWGGLVSLTGWPLVLFAGVLYYGVKFSRPALMKLEKAKWTI